MDIVGLYPIQAMVAAALLKHRRVMLMLPRQEGKTEIGVRINRAILDTNETRQTMFLAKSKSSAKKAVREKFLRLFEKEKFRVNTESIINIANPQAIGVIESVDKDPDKIRGGTYGYIHWSEVAFSNIEKGNSILSVLQRIILPAQRKTNGFLLLESTTNGQNEWQELWENPRELEAIRIKVSLSMLCEMGLVSLEEYERIKKDTLPLVFQQEYEVQFVKFHGLIYEEKMPYHVTDFSLPDTLDTVAVGIDWGYRDATCMLAGYRYKGKFWIFDEIYCLRTLLSEFANKMKIHISMWNAKAIAVVADHDPNRIAELHLRGIPCSNADKSDVLGCRIQIKELFFRDEIRIHPRCKMLLRDLDSMAWNDDQKAKREDANYDDCTWGHFDGEAAMRYLIRNLVEVPEIIDEEIDLSNGNRVR